MPRMIKDRQIIEDEWTLLSEPLLADELLSHEADKLIVPLKSWLEHRDLLTKHNAQIGVWLDSDEQPEALAADLGILPLIALNFPEFKDGRAFSSARALRQNLNYTGEIRAIGDVAHDQLFYMARCGFNSFDMREDQDLEECLQAFDDFKDAYQPGADQPLPLFRRRSA